MLTGHYKRKYFSEDIVVEDTSRSHLFLWWPHWAGGKSWSTPWPVFPSLSFLKTQISPLPSFNAVWPCDLIVKVASCCLQLWDVIPPIQQEDDGEKRHGKCAAVGEGRSWMLRQLLECGGCWKGKEEKGIGAGLPTISTQGGVPGKQEEHMAVGHYHNQKCIHYQVEVVSKCYYKQRQ